MDLKNISWTVLKVTFRIFTYLILLFIIYFVGMRAFAFGEKIFSEEGAQAKPGTQVEITIPQSADKDQIIDILYDSGLVKDKTVFQIQSILYEMKAKAGTYSLNTSDSPEEIIKVITAGPKSEEETDDSE